MLNDLLDLHFIAKLCVIVQLENKDIPNKEVSKTPVEETVKGIKTYILDERRKAMMHIIDKVRSINGLDGFGKQALIHIAEEYNRKVKIN